MSIILLLNGQVLEAKASSIVVGYSQLTPADIAAYTGKAYSTAQQTLIASIIKAV